MTTRSYTDGAEIPAQPTVRSAWDAVKREVTMLAMNAVTTGLLAASSIGQAAMGHSLPAIGFGISAAGFGLVSLLRAASGIGILKNIPAPNPQSAIKHLRRFYKRRLACP
jgi:hypothetical protein